MTEAAQSRAGRLGRDVTRPNPARMYDFMLGGSANFAVDREAVERIRVAMPGVDLAAWANRAFHQRAAMWIAREGVRQFLDIGCGLPTVSNTHDVVRRVTPAAHVVYIDHDPVVIQHTRQLLAGHPNTSLVLGDVREPAEILTGVRMDGRVDLARPVGLLCTAVMHFVADADDPWWCMAQLVGALAPGSFLVLSHVTGDRLARRTVAAGVETYQGADEQIHPRPRVEVAQFFAGLELVPPYMGARPELYGAGLWACEDPVAADDESSRVWWCGVARKGVGWVPLAATG
jgi:hypothetical protein